MSLSMMVLGMDGHNGHSSSSRAVDKDINVLNSHMFPLLFPVPL
jgi:hypothetical protein